MAIEESRWEDALRFFTAAYEVQHYSQAAVGAMRALLHNPRREPGDDQRALEWFNKARYLDAFVIYEHGLIYYTRGDFSKALEIWTPLREETAAGLAAMKATGVWAQYLDRANAIPDLSQTQEARAVDATHSQEEPAIPLKIPERAPITRLLMTGSYPRLEDLMRRWCEPDRLNVNLRRDPDAVEVLTGLYENWQSLDERDWERAGLPLAFAYRMSEAARRELLDASSITGEMRRHAVGAARHWLKFNAAGMGAFKPDVSESKGRLAAVLHLSGGASLRLDIEFIENDAAEGFLPTKLDSILLPFGGETLRYPDAGPATFECDREKYGYHRASGADCRSRL